MGSVDVGRPARSSALRLIKVETAWQAVLRDVEPFEASRQMTALSCPMCDRDLVLLEWQPVWARGGYTWELSLEEGGHAKVKMQNAKVKMKNTRNAN